MRFVGRGHGAIRATHTKTLELSGDLDITARATCIVAVGAIPTPPEPLAGPVRITIHAGGESCTLHALANPSWDPAGPAVIRRSALRLPGTLATHADAAAADLPRTLVAALQSPDAVVEVLIEPVPTQRPTVVLFAADPLRPADPRLRAEQDAADTVVAQDAGARALVASAPAGDTGMRTLVVATAELPRHPGPPGAAVETVGLTAGLAAAAATPGDGPVLLAPEPADARDLLLRTPAAHRLVLTTTAPAVPDLLALAHELRGSSTAVLAQEFAPPLRVATTDAIALPGRDLVHVCFEPPAGDETLDPDVRAAVEGLLADGVPTKTAAGALARLTGWPRRRAYDVVVGWRTAT